jgi:Zn-dependent protease
MPNLWGQTDLIELLYRIPALLLALTLHEAAHGYVAYRLGDPTAKDHGRLTLNPLKHLDPVGMLALLLFRFGWAKPVPVNPMYFEGNKRRGMFLVGLAGPVTNFLLAFAVALLIVMLPFLQIGVVGIILWETFIISTFLGVFNLLPIPPLDGSKVLAYFLPKTVAYQFAQLDRYGPLLLMALIFTGALSRVLIPMATFTINLILVLASLLAGIF